MQTAADQPTARLPLNPQVILTTLRNQLALVKEQWQKAPATLKTVGDQVGAHLRKVLDVPSREELRVLVARLAELDAQLAALTASNQPAGRLDSPVVVEEQVAQAAEAPKPAKNGEEKRHRKH